MAIYKDGVRTTGEFKEKNVGTLGSSWTPNLSEGDYFIVTVSGAVTINFPSGIAPGQGFVIKATNGGSNITWGTGYKWASGTAPTLTSSGVDLLAFSSSDGVTVDGAPSILDIQ